MDNPPQSLKHAPQDLTSLLGSQGGGAAAADYGSSKLSTHIASGPFSNSRDANKERRLNNAEQ